MGGKQTEGQGPVGSTRSVWKTENGTSAKRDIRNGSKKNTLGVLGRSRSKTLDKGNSKKKDGGGKKSRDELEKDAGAGNRLDHGKPKGRGCPALKGKPRPCVRKPAQGLEPGKTAVANGG